MKFVKSVLLVCFITSCNNSENKLDNNIPIQTTIKYTSSTVTPSATVTATPVPSSTPITSPTITPISTPTPSATVTATPVPSEIPKPSATITPTPMPTPLPTPLSPSSSQVKNFVANFDGSEGTYLETSPIVENSLSLNLKTSSNKQMGVYSGGSNEIGKQLDVFIYSSDGLSSNCKTPYGAENTKGIYLTNWMSDIVLPFNKINDNTYHKVTISINENKIYLSVDGEFPDGFVGHSTSGWVKQSQPFNMPLKYDSSSENTTLIGQTRHLLCDKATGSRFFEGNIDDIKIWDRALSKEEIVALENEANNTINGLQAFYNFDDNKLDDKSGKNNPLKVYGNIKLLSIPTPSTTVTPTPVPSSTPITSPTITPITSPTITPISTPTPSATVTATSSKLYFSITANATSNEKGISITNLVDGNVFTYWGSGSYSPAWLKLALESKTFLTAIKMIPHSTPAGECFLDLLGSNDDINYEIIKENIIFNSPTAKDTNEEFKSKFINIQINTTKPYQYYKLNLKNWANGRSWIAIGEIELYGSHLQNL